MPLSAKEVEQTTVARLALLVEEFGEIFAARAASGTTAALDAIEGDWKKLREQTEQVYQKMVSELVGAVDERAMIAKKKTEWRERGILLKTDKADSITLTTTQGKVSYARYALRPTDKEQRNSLEKMAGSKSVVPLDEWLGVARLPFKMSVKAMLEVAFWAQNQNSYQRSEKILKRNGMPVNDTTIRQVANFVGGFVFRRDSGRAAEAMEKFDSGRLEFSGGRQGVVYIETDGAALNTRQKDEAGSTWRENKLGEVFTTDDIYWWTDKHEERRHALKRKEYVSYIGPAGEFKKHLLACALRNGYGEYKETVLLSDGATWIRNMKDELFSDAQQILDYYHLCENVSNYAKQIFKMDEKRYKPWSEQVCKALKAGEHKKVLDDIGKPSEGKKEENCVNLYGYIENNANSIDYPAYIAKGYFIGSGAIESGNKTVLQQRLKQAGMRWNVESAQPMLTLRAKSESDLWEKDVVVPFAEAYVGALSSTYNL
jgi:hypothetical protein